MIPALRLIVRAGFTIACILLITLLMTVTHFLRMRRVTRAIMQSAFRSGAWVWGITVQTQGTLATARPLLVVSNHFSYLDLFVLGSKIPAAFTPKTEVRSWPLLGFMSKVSGCLFIDRRATKTRENNRLLAQALASGDVISLFPEGTTGDGSGLLPFKSALFSFAEDSNIDIQPVSVIYTALNGLPVNAAARPIIGWYGDSYFFPHVIQFLKQKNLEARIVFHMPVRPRDFSSRKELASYCRTVIETSL